MEFSVSVIYYLFIKVFFCIVLIRIAEFHWEHVYLGSQGLYAEPFCNMPEHLDSPSY